MYLVIAAVLFAELGYQQVWARMTAAYRVRDRDAGKMTIYGWRFLG